MPHRIAIVLPRHCFWGRELESNQHLCAVCLSTANQSMLNGSLALGQSSKTELVLHTSMNLNLNLSLDPIDADRGK
jgi:hypothetical protein